MVIRHGRAQLALGALCTVLVACESDPSARSVLNAHLEAVAASDWAEAYRHLSTEDQSTRSLADYTPDEGTLDFASAAQVEFDILSIQEAADSAHATVAVTAPDVGSLFADMWAAAMGSAFGGEDRSDSLLAAIEEKVASGKVPMVTEEMSFVLVREPTGWRVFKDWKTKDQISTLMEDARKLEQQQKLHAARDRYAEVLELDSELVEAAQAHEEVGQKIDAFDEKQAYIGNVELYNLSAAYFDTFLDKQVPGVRFKLRNKGDRTLNRVEVTVYFKDESGTIIAEEDYLPVLVSEYSFNDSSPLKPNYIWQMEGSKFYKAESVPTEWDEGAVAARVTDIEFGD